MAQPLPTAVARPCGPRDPFPRQALAGSIGARFERMAQRHADHVALRTSSATVSYAQLDREANRIAHALLEAGGSGPEPVGLLLEKDAPMLAAILGALKAGKPYVPLEPAFPGARIAATLEDSGAPLVVTSRPLADRNGWLAAHPVRVLTVEDCGAHGRGGSPRPCVPPSTPAAILYTSGSTGRPKGVLHSHRTLLHQVLRFGNALGIGSEDRMTLLASPSTGQATADLLTALLNGASLHAIDVRQEGWTGLTRRLLEEEITYFGSSASLFRHWAEHLSGDEGFPQLRLVKLGSEPVSAHDLALFREHFPDGCVFVNALSSTEAWTFRMNLLDRHARCEGRIVPSGHPVDDVEVRVVREGGAPAAPGEVGEIVVRSRFLASGYWRRPDLTAKAFRADSRDPELRTFFTGDLGRMAEDGCLLHLGRKDAQVMVRGHRIELAEVEMALLEHANVRHAVVVDRQDHRGETRLVAYFVATAGDTASPGALRRFLDERLPGHMVPYRFVALDALPTTANGKVDRKALPWDDEAAAAPDRPRTAPRDILETLLRSIWEDLLGRSDIGVQDEFVDVGGDSLLAVELAVRIEEACGRNVDFSHMIDGLTIERLARVLGESELGQLERVDGPFVAFQREGSKRPLFFLHGDFETGGLYCRNLARHLGPQQPFYALLPHGLAGDAIPTTIEAMAADRLATVRAIQPRGPYRLGGFCNGGVVAFEMAQQLRRSGEDVEVVLLIDARARNAPYRWIHRAVGLAGRVGVLRPEAQRARFARLREIIERLPRGTGPRLRHVLAKSVSTVGRWLHGVEDVPPPEAPEPAVPDRRTAQWHEYNDALEHYVAARHPGPLVLFRSSHLLTRPPGGEAAGWDRVTPRLDVHWLPGNHRECITRHVGVLADRMKPYLAA